jgi:hypothetical protein
MELQCTHLKASSKVAVPGHRALPETPEPTLESASGTLLKQSNHIGRKPGSQRQKTGAARLPFEVAGVYSSCSRLSGREKISAQNWSRLEVVSQLSLAVVVAVMIVPILGASGLPIRESVE